MKTLHAFKQNLYMGLSFLFPFLILGLAYALFGVYPFGHKTILISDMSGQYLDFYSAFYDMLTQGKSLFYSWEAGMGLNFIGIYAYYLSSPFSFLILLFEKEHLPEALFLLTLLKVGLAGFTFSIYARFIFQGHKSAILGFSVIYALMSYSIVYSFNIMWLDAIIFLPLVLLGIEKLVRQGQFLVLGISLWLLFIANFYIAYMVGLFSFFYFLITYGTQQSFRHYQTFLYKLGQFLASALLAAGCAAFILIPTLFALSNGPNSFELSRLWEFKVNFPLFDLLNKFLLGSYDSLSYGLPNISTGLFPLLLLPLFVVNSTIALKEKVSYLSLLIFLLISFNLWNLNIVWHAFDIPDWFPYRYSFLFSFLVVFLAFKAYKGLQPSDLPRILKIYGFLFLMIILIQKFNYPHLSAKAILVNLFFLSVYALALILIIQRPNQRKVISIVLISFILCEGFFNSWYLIRRLNSQFGYATKESVEAKLTPMQTLIEEIQSTDSNFYRLERVAGRTHNDALNLGYRGIAHFSSMSNGNLHRFLQQLGFTTWSDYKVLTYSGSTLLTDSLFGVKYRISPELPPFGYEQRLSTATTQLAKKAYLYENTNVLPLAFVANRQILNINNDVLNLRQQQDKASPSTKNPFELQNSLLNLSLGTPADSPSFINYFIPLRINQVKLENLTSTNLNGKPYYEKRDRDQDAFIRYTAHTQTNQQLYMYLPSGMSAVEITLNDKVLGDFSFVDKIIDLGFYSKDEVLEISLRLKYQNHPYYPNPFYALDAQAFSSSMKTLQQGAMQELKVSDTSLTGKVTTQNNQLLFTTIPFDPGWEVFVDGIKTPITKIGDAFIGINLNPGTHDIRFAFMPQGLTLGFIVTGFSFALLLGFTYQRINLKFLTLLGGKLNLENEGPNPE